MIKLKEENLMSNNPQIDAKIEQIEQLEEVMHNADINRTLEEQVADMKRRGINPRDNYKDWDDEQDNWGSNDTGEVKPIQMDDGKEPTPPPFV